MSRTANLVFIVLVLITGAVTYVIKYRSKIEYNVISSLERQVEAEKEAIDILNANWSLLTRPSRIQRLVERHNDELQLKNLNPDQVIGIDQIPFKLLNKKNADERMAANPAIDSDVLTGGVKQGGRE